MAVSEDLGFAAVDDEVSGMTFGHAVAALADAGVQIVRAVPGLTSSVATWATIATAEARWSEATEYEQHPERLSASVREYLGFGEQVSAKRYIRAQFERERIHVDLRRVLRQHRYQRRCSRRPSAASRSTTRCPTRHGIGGVEVDEVWRDWAPMLYDANLAGLPACSVPIGTGPAACPIGGQFIARWLSDHRLPGVAAILSDVLSLPTATR